MKEREKERENRGESKVAGGERKRENQPPPTHPPVRLIVSDDCLRIMAETHNSDYNACSSNNAVTSRSVVYVNVPARASRRRVRRLFRVPLSPSPFLRGSSCPSRPRPQHPSLSLPPLSAILRFVIRGPITHLRSSEVQLPLAPEDCTR